VRASRSFSLCQYIDKNICPNVERFNHNDDPIEILSSDRDEMKRLN